MSIYRETNGFCTVFNDVIKICVWEHGLTSPTRKMNIASRVCHEYQFTTCVSTMVSFATQFVS